MKYELGQTIWYILENKPHSAKVLARKTVENLHPDFSSTKEQKEIFTPFGIDGTYYGTCHGIVEEQEAFPSKEELVAAL